MASSMFVKVCAVFAVTTLVAMASALAQGEEVKGVAPPSSGPSATAESAAPAPDVAGDTGEVAPSRIEVRMHREPLRQLGRGIANLVTGVWEIPRNIFAVNREMGDCAGASYGILRGLWRFGCREITGVFEIVTFPFGWQPIIEPEFYMEPAHYTDWRVIWPPQWSQQAEAGY